VIWRFESHQNPAGAELTLPLDWTDIIVLK